MNKIRKGDEIIVISGKDKGKHGAVLTISGNYVMVEGINCVKKHCKPNPIKNATGGIVSKLMPLHISNVSLSDSNGRATRVGTKVKNGKKVRFLKTTSAILSA
ncbi:50S ribosomal protein L24 [Candidatus Vallotia tarda]|uniref:Large ribosomal subunit protein uL24 n=1 Tax=Candidatus Vallotiella hemipterorum TaxID=1177213 RepID=A0A916JWQ7_9BURK|nr:50S ribosomal protein L24 [Candidatus Vallotia tarda]CAG7603630.1 50S ribosomal protein L24 [Candidatus Vallotia tarda]